MNLTLPAGPAEEVAARAKEGVRAGYQCFKLKVGRPDDEERVAAVREAIGSWPALRLDANGVWSADEAIERIEALEPNDLELVEQPCATLPELAEVRQRVSTPIAADESITGPDDVRAAAAAQRVRRGEREALLVRRRRARAGRDQDRGRVGDRRLSVEHLRRPVGDLRRAPARGRRDLPARVRPRDARAVRLAARTTCSSPPAAG